MDKPKKTSAELIAIALAELSDHDLHSDGLNISVVTTDRSWEFRTNATAQAEAAPGYAECVAKLMQISDHLSAQYDCNG